MSHNRLANIVAFAFAAVFTASTFGIAAVIAGQQYTQASMNVLDDMPVMSEQTVVVVAKRV